MITIDWNKWVDPDDDEEPEKAAGFDPSEM